MPTTKPKTAKAQPTPAELLQAALEATDTPEGFVVPLEEEFKPALVTRYAKEDFLPKISFTIENGKNLFKMLFDTGYIVEGTALLELFELHESQTKWNKKVQYLTPRGDWLKTTGLNTATIPSELDVVAGA